MTRSILLIITFTILSPSWFSQASWSTEFAFILRDENNKALDLQGFKASYQLINVFGDTVSNEDLVHYIRFDEKTNYFILDITTIAPIFSFAIAYNDELMAIYLPFDHEHKYYAVDIPFRKGKFLFDFKIMHKEKIYFNGNIPHYIIKTVNWKKQAKRYIKSSYSKYNTSNLKTNETH